MRFLRTWNANSKAVGWTLTLVCLAAFLAPVMTCIVADQWYFPGEQVAIGFFVIAALCIRPVAFTSALDLNWLSI